MPPSTPPAAAVVDYASDPESVGSGRRARRGGLHATKTGLRMPMRVGNKKRGGAGASAAAASAAAGVGADDDTAAGVGAARHARGCFVFLPLACRGFCRDFVLGCCSRPVLFRRRSVCSVLSRWCGFEILNFPVLKGGEEGWKLRS